MEYIIFILIVVLLFSIYANYNMVKKNETMEDATELLINRLDESQKFIQDFSDNLSLIENSLKQIDHKGIFEADDEVGYTFKSIKLITSKLQEFNINAEKKEG